MEKKFTKADYVGMIIGFGIAILIFKLGNFGVIPATLIAFGCYWIVKKIAEKIIKS